MDLNNKTIRQILNEAAEKTMAERVERLVKRTPRFMHQQRERDNFRAWMSYHGFSAKMVEVFLDYYGDECEEWLSECIVATPVMEVFKGGILTTCNMNIINTMRQNRYILRVEPTIKVPMEVAERVYHYCTPSMEYPFFLNDDLETKTTEVLFPTVYYLEVNKMRDFYLQNFETKLEVVDVCLPDYFRGYHKPVLSVPVFGGMSAQEFIDTCHGEYSMVFDYLESDWPWLEEHQFKKLVKSMLSDPNTSNLFPALPEPDPDEDEDTESVFCYITLTEEELEFDE